MNYQKFINKVLKAYYEGKNLVIFNIGTSSLVYDSFGPILGTLLEEKHLKNFKIIGTMNDNANAKNIKEKYKLINQTTDFIIATDAAILKKNQLENMIILRNSSIEPGSGMGKDLGSIGDISIKYLVNKEYAQNFLKDMRLEDPYNAAKIISDFLKSIDNIIELEKILYNKNKNNERSEGIC